MSDVSCRCSDIPEYMLSIDFYCNHLRIQVMGTSQSLHSVRYSVNSISLRHIPNI